MAKLRSRREHHFSALQQLQPGVESDFAKGDDDADLRKMSQLDVEVVEAAGDLFGAWLVVRWRASNSGEDVCVREMHPIIGTLRRGDIRKAGSMKRRHQEVTRAVSSEDTPCSIGTMSSWRES